MKDALQTDDTGITIDEGETSETAESGADLATAAGEDQSKNEDGDKSQDAVNKAINKQHAKYREEERKRLEIEKERDELKDKLAAAEADKGEILIPPIPDPFDEDYEEKIAVRDKSIMQKAEQDTQNKSVLEQKNATIQAEEDKDKERLNNLVTSFDSRITPLGLDPADVKNAVNTVVGYGISKEVGEYILQHEDGPLITKYLAENPVELDDLRNMTIIDAAFKIQSDIATAASAMKPQASSAPDPAEILTGRGAGEQKDPLIKGATFT
jgi:multidrug efflux pump subunit AcrB